MQARIISALIWGSLLIPVAANAQHYISNRDAKVDLWLPEDWVIHVWNLTNDSNALAHVGDAQSGRQVVVQLRACEADDLQGWASGDMADSMLSSRVDSIAPADEETAQLLPEAASFVTTIQSDSLVMRARTFFAVESERCYLIELITKGKDFGASFDTFAEVVRDMRFDKE